MRKDYQHTNLEQDKMAADPLTEFNRWFENALAQKVPEPNAIVLATADVAGRPSARMMLLKNYDEKGLVLYTNYHSRKGNDIAENDHVALLIWWQTLHQQIRFEGTIEKVPPEQSDAYFAVRNKQANLGAIASPQSEVIESRQILADRYSALEKQFENDEQLIRPEHWGGYLVKPNYVEFWQGASHRLHDRIVYTLTDDEQHWQQHRLAP